MGIRLGIGYFAVLVSCALLAFGALGPHVAGYVAGTILAFTLAAMARRSSLTAATETGKPEAPRVVMSVRLLVVIGFLVGIVHAWYIARALS